jgi:hypothetical protein
MRALEAASMQQRMMVAGFTCHDASRYNEFVMSHRGELQRSDATLLAFFKNGHGGEAAYHTYKTHLANHAALNSAEDGAFCERVSVLFSHANRGGALSDIVDSLPVNDTGYDACESRVMTASADRPFRDAAQGAASTSAPVRMADAAATDEHGVPDQAPARVGDAVPEQASAGVPDQAPPARVADTAPEQASAAVPDRAPAHVADAPAQPSAALADEAAPSDDADDAPPVRSADIAPPSDRGDQRRHEEEMNGGADDQRDADADSDDDYRDGWRQADRGDNYRRGYDDDYYRDGPYDDRGGADDEDDAPYDDAPPSSW